MSARVGFTLHEVFEKFVEPADVFPEMPFSLFSLSRTPVSREKTVNCEPVTREKEV